MSRPHYVGREIMQPIHIFYKELPVDENNIFTANLAEKNEVKVFKFKRSREYAITGLSINQDIDSDLIMLTDTRKQNKISDQTKKLVKEKKEPHLNFRICNEAFGKIIP